jgi:hypothetical protein
MAQAAADIPWLTLTKHDEKKRGHENMIRPPIDENHIVVATEFPAQMGCGNNATTAASQNDDPLTSVQQGHLALNPISGLIWVSRRSVGVIEAQGLPGFSNAGPARAPAPLGHPWLALYRTEKWLVRTKSPICLIDL